MIARILEQSPLSAQAQSVAAKTATAISGGGFITSIASANEVIQLIAGVVAIVAGVAAAWWHFERIHDARSGRRERRMDRARRRRQQDDTE